MRTVLAALAGTAVGASLALTMTTSTDTAPQCYEDEVIVWTGTEHDACVSLDDFWHDPDTGTVHWYYSDQR